MERLREPQLRGILFSPITIGKALKVNASVGRLGIFLKGSVGSVYC